MQLPAQFAERIAAAISITSPHHALTEQREALSRFTENCCMIEGAFVTKATDHRHHPPLARGHESKKLYHFTSKRAARKIVVQGLKANWVLDMPAELVGAMRGVWLTDDPQLPPKFSASAERRIELVIPLTDVRLVQWRSMLRERISSNQLAAIDRKRYERPTEPRTWCGRPTHRA